ncbi:response regulator [Thermogemmatispora sp.]|uniref:response regulator n=1 Tax=Thermogemmatispora sp. TaxID=1968838 RepID=UPI001DA5E15A|nr:response regulator [Thermogemmatispora sp.]MBX5451565.1 response regulator [Thermogemmatispora sp.]
MHISLLEDDSAIQELLLLVLQDEGYSVTVYPTAEECLKALRGAAQDQAPSPDLLIVDWRLPGPVSGIEVIQQVRTLPQYRSLPIILTTAATLTEPEDEEVQGLQVKLLEKPFAIDDVVRLIRDLTQQSQPQRSSEHQAS